MESTALHEVIEGFQLSPQQRRLWRLNATDNCGPYLALCGVVAEGELDRAALKAAIEEAAKCHEILRTGFCRLDSLDLPLQVIGDRARLSISDIDLTGLSPRQQEEGIEACFVEHKRAPFDLARDPLLRASLLALTQAKHVLILSLPALCADGEAVWGLAREIGWLYEATLAGDETHSSPLQYADLASWQNDLLESDDTRPGRDYWSKQDWSARVPLKMPFEKEPRPGTDFDPRCLDLSIHPDLVAKIDAITCGLDLRPSEFLLACYHLLVWRLTGCAETVVFSHFGGRKFDEIENALGLFGKYLPIACHLDGSLRFVDLLEHVDQVARRALKWQECYNPEHVGGSSDDPARLDLQPISYEFDEPAQAFSAGNIRFSLWKRETCIDWFKVKISCSRDGGSLAARFHYDSRIFAADDVVRLTSQFESLVAQATADPEITLREMTPLSAPERRLVDRTNDTAAGYNINCCVHQLVAEQAARTPDAVAVVYEDEQISFSRLDAEANRLAARLRRLGARPDVVVPVCLARSIELVVALLGVLKAGAAFTPLDPDYPKERLETMLSDACPPVVLTEPRLLGSLPEHRTRVLCLDRDLQSADDERPGSELANGDDLGICADNLAYVIYTSGSTGTPKGAMIPHRAIVNRLLWMRSAFPLSPDDSVLQKTAFSFDASVWEFFEPLLTGARVVMARPRGHLEAGYLVQTVARHEVTTLQLVPTMLSMLLDADGIEACKSLRRVFSGGEALSSELQSRAFGAFACALHNLYGPTETAIDAACWTCDPKSESTRVPIGHPIANVKLHLAAPEMVEAGLGVDGEILIGGAGLARGYAARPAETAERFIPDPFDACPGKRLYRSGDLARRRRDGAVEFVGRKDYQVKIRGFRIEPAEIEATLARHPAIVRALVVPREYGPADNRLIAYVIPGAGVELSIDDVSEFLRSNLPEYMVPSAIVSMTAFPLMANGKVDRHALPAPETRSKIERQLVALPRDNLETQLVQVWKAVLGTEGPIGIKDSFFDLGGHSLLAVRLMAQIRKWFGQELPLSVLFEGPTIEHLATALRGQADCRVPSPIVAIQPRGSKPPFFCVHTGSGEVLCYEPWARHLDPDQPFYGIQDHFAYGTGDPEVPLEQMARCYVDELLAARPRGPYLLGGWSFGGVVAFEMAQQLRRLGREVPLLVLVDTGAPAFLKKIMQADDAVLLTILANQFTQYSMSEHELRGLTASLRPLGPDDQLQFVVNYFVDNDLIGAALDMDYARDFLQRHLRVFRARVRVTQGYEPEVYDGRITLFRASDEPPELMGLDATKGWGELATAPVQVHIVPGNHQTMGLDPHVAKLAERLQACINETAFVPSAM
jgi:amino acid adenylation domain-containing protein